MGRTSPEYLPPTEAWLACVYALPELRAYPQHLNSTEELLDRHVIVIGGDGREVRAKGGFIPYADLMTREHGPVEPVRRGGKGWNRRS